MGEQHIGHPCPDCGADMLTRDDYVVGLRMQATLAAMEMIGLAQPHMPGDEVPDNMRAMRFHYHAGKLDVEVGDDGNA